MKSGTEQHHQIQLGLAVAVHGWAIGSLLPLEFTVLQALAELVARHPARTLIDLQHLPVPGRALLAGVLLQGAWLSWEFARSVPRGSERWRWLRLYGRSLSEWALGGLLLMGAVWALYTSVRQFLPYVAGPSPFNPLEVSARVLLIYLVTAGLPEIVGQSWARAIARGFGSTQATRRPRGWMWGVGRLALLALMIPPLSLGHSKGPWLWALFCLVLRLLVLAGDLRRHQGRCEDLSRWCVAPRKRGPA
ncbi:MAG: hypothetical protein VKO21_05625 [Candidatus Sericytochromatia bacterium]|nr:hypothetical protein [Candidatus Sericytochromatia bacterium]